MELRVFTKEESIKENQHSSEVVWSFPLSSWAYYHKLHQMEWIVQLGFELEIYQTSELAGTYWYTCFQFCPSAQRIIALTKLINGQVPSISG